ncbi:carbamoyl-phosphate synthase large subunit [Candidatus Curtissbacteria bacterium]|nr:carbamoyl-phosphate synthase large subunit [Candidatus Curtissbacteria bacterium]
MNQKSNIKKVLLLGSGALQIGQAGEFDYSGSQAIKALKEEGLKVVLVNPNIATIQTSWNFADKVYFLPLTPHFVEGIIKAEKPNGILLSFGGQTALNCGLELEKSGVFKKYGVQILGSPISAVKTTENRHLFVEMLKKINLRTPRSKIAKTLKEAAAVAKTLGFPLMVRGGFSLGGQDSGVVQNIKELSELASKALAKVPHVLIEEYLAGWKEIEYEVVRDKFDNCVTVCNMENIDPMGIHTGESIVVAPSQTLNNFEYHTLRQIAIKVIRHLGIIGECNIQFALNPKPKKGTTSNQSTTSITSQDKNPRGTRDTLNSRDTLDYRIIEVNARLSRSSALASKATGYPLAYVAAKLALGHRLTEIKNSVTKTTTAAFEPALDYLVVKFPRWDLEKFIGSQDTIGTSMQSVGEVMAVGRKFEEALQKAARMLDIGTDGIILENHQEKDYKKPTPWRLFAIAKSLKRGVSTAKIARDTKIDKFFLEKIKNITDMEKSITGGQGITSTTGIKKARDARGTLNSRDTLLSAKQLGFSDSRLAKLTGTTQAKIRAMRHALNIRPSTKQIDTLAAEYPAQTNYLYLTYNGDKDDVVNNQLSVFSSQFSDKSLSVNQKISLKTEKQKTEKQKSENRQQKTDNRSVIVLGSGPYRIGSSVEFDWCSVTCAQTLEQSGIDPIIVNCNPETVSTDYDMAKRLYFEELTLETVLEIYAKENPLGVIVSMGGQTPNNLVLDLARQKVRILGTAAASIDRAEDRHKFSSLCDALGINQPVWAKVKDVKDAVSFSQKIGFPVLVRPSYVLSGVAFNVAFDANDLENYLKVASRVSEKYPVVISKFFENAKEIEIDAVAREGKILTHAICEHVENAGVHSGDSTLVLPPQKIYAQTENQIKNIATQIAKNLEITGPFNIQFLARDNKVSVIECNLRASRSLPFVSKVTGVNFVKLATEAIIEAGGTSGRGPASAQSSYGQLEQYGEMSKRRALAGRKLVTGPAVNNISYVAVKAPQFSFSRVKGADPILRVEMASTGEVACFGADIYEAFLKSQIATGIKLPKKSVFISLGGDENKIKFLASARLLADFGLKIYATTGTSKFLASHGIKNQRLHKIYENKKPTVVDYLTAKKIDLVINVFEPYQENDLGDGYIIRRATVDWGIPLLTNLHTAELFAKAMAAKKLGDLKILPWDQYVKNLV